MPSLLPPTTREAPISSQASVRVDRLRFEGNTAFLDAQLLAAPVGTAGEIVSSMLGRELTLDQLEQIRVAITLRYVDAGYINSGAVIPDQPVPADGTLLVQIVEGRLSDVDITGTNRLRRSFVADRIDLSDGPPLNVFKLRDRLEILRQDPRLKRINAELRPGNAPGEASLDVAVEESNPASLALLFSNRRPPSVGAERFELLAGYGNVLGFGDAFNLRYGINKGELSDWEFAGSDDFSISYSVPVSPRDTTVIVEFSRSDTTVVEEPFNELDLDTENTRFALTLRHPLYRTPATEFALFGGVSAQYTTTRLSGERIDLSPGSVGGESNVFAVRFGQEFFTRDTKRAVSFRSTFSFGVDAFESTTNSGDTADSRFVSWLGQAQYVRRIGETNAQFVARAAAQLTPHSLLGPEQFAVGGVDTVRGYRENQLVRDNGVVGSLELRIPLWSKKIEQTPILEFAPFIDAGYAFNRDQRPDGEYLISVGAGFLFNPNDHINASVYYGRHLNDVSSENGDLQDLGIHFSILIRAF